MKYENPNCSAFFFDDGDFLNLEGVQYVAWLPDGIADIAGDTEPPPPEPALRILGPTGTIVRWNPSDAERKRLSDALRIYHSKL